MTSTELLESDVRYEDYAEKEDEILGAVDYDITTSPNDFNVSTIYNFIKSGVLVIPSFQRNYVWDIKRASKLIESLIIGLPVPQIFLYEADRNRFLVIDGQQRLMSLYYFMEQRFPRDDARPELRRIFAEHGQMPDEVLKSDKYFVDFRLSLPERVPGPSNKLHGLSYEGLGEYQFQFSLKTIRNVIIRQNTPKDDDSSIYEIFTRLNSGGVNLSPQELRLSLYHSEFYDMLMQVNYEEEWRRILASPQPNLHLKDVELLLRMFAMLIDGDKYAPSMVQFLNQFSKKRRSNDRKENQYLEALFKSFLKSTSHLPDNVFLNKANGRINIALMEAVFSAACREKYQDGKVVDGKLDLAEIKTLETDPAFVEATQAATTQTANVRKRLERGHTLVTPL